MSESKQTSDQYEMDDEKIAQHYDKLLRTGKLNSSQLGTKKEFVMAMREGDALSRFRQSMLDKGILNENNMGSDSEEYFQTFVKKKDHFTKQRIGTTKDSEEKEEGLDLLGEADTEKTWSSAEVDDFWDEQEVMQLDYQNETTDEQADEFAVRADNIRFKKAPTNDIVVRHSKETARDVNNASNDFIQNREKSYTRHLDEGQLGKYYNESMKAAETKYNQSGNRVKRRSLKNAMYAAHTDHLATSITRENEANGWSLRDVIVNPDIMEKQRTHYLELGMPKKQWDLAKAEVMQDKPAALLSDEGLYVQDRHLEYQKEGYDPDEAMEMVATEIQATQEKTIIETLDMRARKRLELIRKEQDLMNNPQANPEDIYKVRAQIAALPDKIHDIDGKRIGDTGSRAADEFESDISSAIDAIKELPFLQDPGTFKENLHRVRDERWMMRSNLKREYEAVQEEINELAKIGQEQSMAHGSMDKSAQLMMDARQTYIEKLQRKEKHLRQQYRSANVSWQASARMLALNENPTAQDRGFSYYGNEFVAGMIDYVPNIRKVDKRKVTEADFVREFEGTLSEAGYTLTPEEKEYVEKDLAGNIVRAMGGGAAFAADMALTTVLTKGLGVEAAIARGVGLTRKVVTSAKAAKRFKGAKVVTSKALYHVTNQTSAALLEGAKFAVTTGDIKEAPVGVGFYAINKMLPGLRIPSPLAKSIFDSFYKSSVGLAAASMGTEASHVAFDALAHDQNVKGAIADHFGSGDELTDRITTELAVGLMFGAHAMPKNIRSRHVTATPKQMNWVINRAIKKGKMDGAIDIANEKFNYLDKNEVYNRSKETHAKFNWLKKYFTATAVEKGDYKRMMSELFDKSVPNPEKIDMKFNELVKEHSLNTDRLEADIYEEVIGRDSFDTLEQKRINLERITGESFKEYGPGEVEVVYERMKLDPKYAVKLREGMKVIEEDRRIQTKSERLENEMNAAMKEVGVEEGIAVTTEKDAKQSEASREEVSEVKKAHAKEAREIQKNLVPKKIRKRVDEYLSAKKDVKRKRILNDIAADLRIALKQAERSSVKKTSKNYTKLKRAIETIEKYQNTNKVMTPAAIESLYVRAETALNIFTPKNITDRITTRLDKLTKKSKEDSHEVERRFDPKTDFMAKTIKALFTGETNLIKELNERVSSGIESLSKDKELYDPVQIEKFEAVRSTLEHSKTRESAKKRRAELEAEAVHRELTNAEQMEYELLNFRDASTMTMGELHLADAAMKVLINNGTSLKKNKDTFDKIQAKNDLNETSKVLDPKRWGNERAIAEGEKAETEQQKIDFIEKYGKQKNSEWKSSKESITDAYKKLIGERYKIAEELGRSKFRKLLAGGRLSIESFPSIMENFSQRMPGRDAMTGYLHTFSDQILGARRGKEGELGYWASIRARGIEKIFGSITKANEIMMHWGKKEHVFQLTKEKTGVKIPMKMSIQKALTLLSYSRQAGQKETWAKKGFELTDKNGDKGKAVRDLETQITELAGKEAIEWMDFIVKEYQPRLYHRLNEKYREHKGTDLEYILNHTPLVRQGKGEKADRTLFDKPASDYVASTMTSSAKSRTGSDEWYDLRNFNELINNHTERVIHYVHFQAPVLRLKRTFGQEEIQKSIRELYGKPGVAIMKRFEADIAADRTTGEAYKALDWIRNNFVRAKLGINFLLVPKQMMSVQAYTAGLKGGREIAEFHKELVNLDFGIMRQLLKSEFIRGRLSHQSMSRELAQAEASYSTLMSKDPAARAKIIRGETLKEALDPRFGYLKDNLLAPTKFGDIGAILIGAQAQYKVFYKRMLREGYTEKEAASEAYNQVIRSTRRTQQSGAIEDLSHIQRAGSIGKMFTMFMNSPMQYARVELAGWDYLAQAVRDKDTAKAKKGAWDLFFFHFVMPATFHAAQNGFYAGEVKAGEDQDLLRTMGLGSIASIPGVGGVMETIWDQINGGETFGISLGVAASVAEEMEVIAEILGKILQGEELGPGETMDIASSIATLLGVPLDSPYKLVAGIKEYLSGETDDPRALVGYSPYTRGAYERGNFYSLVEKHSTSNGGDLDDAYREVKEEEGNHFFLRNKEYIKKEYLINEHFGGYDRHVNYLNNSRDKSERKAEYIYDLWKVSVLGKRPVMRRRVATKDIFAPEEMNSVEFNRRLGEWYALGVISKRELVMFETKKKGTFEKNFKD